MTNLNVMTNFTYIDFYSLYNKQLIHYLISLDGEVVLAYYRMPGPESDYNLSRFLKRYIYQKL